MRLPEIHPPLRGTYAAFASPPMLDHLVRLGITAVELLPVHAFVDDRHLVQRGLRNYWGYNTSASSRRSRSMRPASRSPSSRPWSRCLHEAGIEVILDVVYNHTCEGNHLGPTLCFRGIDNASYYRLVPGDQRYYIDETGCGNTFNLDPPARPAAGDGLPALLGRGDARRRLPLRPRDDARARASRLRPRQRLFRRDPTGSGAEPGQADRRALGRRAGRLSGRRLPARLRRVERPLSRLRAPLLAGRRGNPARARRPPDRLERSVRAHGPPLMGEHQQGHRARRLHPQ